MVLSHKKNTILVLLGISNRKIDKYSIFENILAFEISNSAVLISNYINGYLCYNMKEVIVRK